MDKKEVQVGRLEADLIEKVDNYTALTNDSRINFIRTLLTDFFKHKIVTKEFIVPERPFYFNMNVLLEEGSVEATTIKPSTDFDNYYTVKKIPNNLDSFSSKYKSYCYNEVPMIHKGIFIYYFFLAEANPVPLVFDYNSTDYAEELTISVIKISDLNFLIETEEDVVTVENVLKSAKDNIESYNEYGASTNNFNFMASISKVIEDFKGRKIIELMANYNVEFEGIGLESDLDYISIKRSNPTEELLSSNIAKDKKIKELEENYLEPLKKLVEEIDRIENLKKTPEGMEKLWNEVIQEQKKS